MKVNPLDVEEIVWDIACQNRLKGLNPNFEMRKMALPQGKNDRRKIMVCAILAVHSLLILKLRLKVNLLFTLCAIMVPD